MEAEIQIKEKRRKNDEETKCERSNEVKIEGVIY